MGNLQALEDEQKKQSAVFQMVVFLIEKRGRPLESDEPCKELLLALLPSPLLDCQIKSIEKL
jgi:hypothetical protein